MIASPEGFDRRRLALAWCAVLVLGTTGLILTQAGSWSGSPGRPGVAAQPDCAAWDRAASEGVAALVSETSATAELRLDEALLQLRRARKNCRAGFVELAGHDYASLRRAFPFSTGSLRADPQDGAVPHLAPAPR